MSCFIIAELVLLYLFAWIAVEANQMRRLGVPVDFTPWEMHHAYFGVALVLAAPWWYWEPVAAGVLITADDVWQHWVQVMMGRRDYESPLHRLFAEFLWPLPVVRRVTGWLNNLLGRRK